MARRDDCPETNSFGARDTVEGGREGNAAILGADALAVARERSADADMDDEPAPDLDQGVGPLEDGVEKVLACRAG